MPGFAVLSLDLIPFRSQESFRPVEAAGAGLLLLSLYLVTTQSDGGAPGDGGGEIAATDRGDETAGKVA